MTDFFDSDIVRKEAQEMEELQVKAMELTLASAITNAKEDKLEYINTVRALIEKHQVFYMRLKLSDDPRAIEMRRAIEDSAKMLYGMWESENVMEVMAEMLSKLDELEKEVEAEG